jgi:hypothetical protein
MLNLNLGKKLVKCYIWNIAVYDTETWTLQKVPGKFWNMLLEQDGDQLDRSIEKWRSVTKNQGREEHPTNYNKKKKFLRRTCLLKLVIEGKIEGRIEVTGGRRTRLKQLLKDFKEDRGYCEFEEEEPRSQCGKKWLLRGYGPVVRRTSSSLRT